MSINSINNLQQELQNMLGLKYSRYLDNMRDWFGQNITKDFFDEQMSSILQDRALKVHNEMMKQIIYLCNGIQAPESTLDIPKSPKAHQETSQEINSYQEDGTIYENMDEVSDFIYINNEELFSYISQEVEPVVEIKPIVPVDWLFNVNSIKVNAWDYDQSDFPPATIIDKIPSNFGVQFQQLRSPWAPSKTFFNGVAKNDTYENDFIDRQNKNSPLKSKQNGKDNQPNISPNAIIHKKFSIKACEHGIIGGVDHKSTQLVVTAAKEHLRKLITEVIKQRRSFLMRDDKVFHSIGAPYPNPYLRQGQQVLDLPYTSDSTKMADVMQVPKMLPTTDELERIATLQVASSAPKKDCRFPANKTTMADLLNVIENDPDIIPITNSRFRLLEVISQKYKGYGGSFPIEMDEMDEDEFNNSDANLLPICSY